MRWLLALFSSTVLFLFPVAGYSATFTVDTVSDVGLTACTAAPNDCSFRGALGAANLTTAADTILFDIPMSDSGCNATTGVCRITSGTTSYPTINNPLTIDGYSQPGAVPNTIPAPGANNAQIKIELTASVNGVGSSFWLAPNSSTLVIKGLALFLPNGAMLGTFGTSSLTVQGCWIGVQADGSPAPYSTQTSAILATSFARALIIGGPTPDARNVIAGSGLDLDNQIGGGGNHLRIVSATGVPVAILLQGNLIGLGPDGNTALPFRDAFRITVEATGIDLVDARILDNRMTRTPRNFSGGFGDVLSITPVGSLQTPTIIQGNVFGLAVNGTRIGSQGSAIRISTGNSATTPNIRIGGSGLNEANAFAAATALPGGATGPAIGWGSIPNNALVDIRSNIWLGNDNLGVDLPSPTGARTANDVGDADLGANGLQNSPEIQTFSLAGSDFALSYRVDSSTSASTYPLRVDFYKARADEGEALIGSDSYEAVSAQTVKSTSLPIPPGLALSADDAIVAIATDALGRSSEFSFSPLTLQIETPTPSSCSGGPAIFCNDFESGLARSINVRVTASSGLFSPNGEVRLTDSRSHSCTLTLRPTDTSLTSAGSCVLIDSGAPGSLTITATYDTLTGAFGSSTGGNVVVTRVVTL